MLLFSISKFHEKIKFCQRLDIYLLIIHVSLYFYAHIHILLHTCIFAVHTHIYVLCDEPYNYYLVVCSQMDQGGDNAHGVMAQVESGVVIVKEPVKLRTTLSLLWHCEQQQCIFLYPGSFLLILSFISANHIFATTFSVCFLQAHAQYACKKHALNLKVG